jgi:hypothetical protein
MEPFQQYLNIALRQLFKLRGSSLRHSADCRLDLLSYVIAIPLKGIISCCFYQYKSILDDKPSAIPDGHRREGIPSPTMTRINTRLEIFQAGTVQITMEGAVIVEEGRP